MIGQVLLIKVAVAIVVGFVVDALVRLAKRDGDGHIHIHELCEQEHCDCEDSVLVSAVKHTLQVTLFIFLVERWVRIGPAFNLYQSPGIIQCS